MMLLIVALLTVALAAVIIGASKINDHVKCLELRIRTLEHLATLETTSKRGATFWSRDLSQNPLPASRGGQHG
jgi:hypothetical protein